MVGRELNELAYEKPAGWFAYLNQRVVLDCPSADPIERIAEAKATRDVLVHNRGVVNATNLAKAGPRARCEAGERIELSQRHHRDTWELFREVVAETSQVWLDILMGPWARPGIIDDQIPF